jgi:hypothetical protein
VIDSTATISPEIAPQQWPAFYERAIDCLPPGVTQFVIHPGLNTAKLQAFSADGATWGAAWRQRDFDFFTSSKFRALLTKRNITRITWREIEAKISTKNERADRLKNIRVDEWQKGEIL